MENFRRKWKKPPVKEIYGVLVDGCAMNWVRKIPNAIFVSDEDHRKQSVLVVSNPVSTQLPPSLKVRALRKSIHLALWEVGRCIPVYIWGIFSRISLWRPPGWAQFAGEYIS